jgi:kumamolisin
LNDGGSAEVQTGTALGCGRDRRAADRNPRGPLRPPLYDLLLDGKPLPDGGTGTATPLWAALIARLDQSLPKAKQQRFLPRLIYQAAASAGFRDIVSGNNASYPNLGKGYVATAGYDAVSGLGVPSGKALLAALAKL